MFDLEDRVRKMARIQEELEAGVQRLLDAEVYAVRKDTGEHVEVPKEFLLGYAAGMENVRYLLDEEADLSGRDGRSLLMYAIRTYAEASLGDGE